MNCTCTYVRCAHVNGCARNKTDVWPAWQFPTSITSVPTQRLPRPVRCTVENLDEWITLKIHLGRFVSRHRLQLRSFGPRYPENLNTREFTENGYGGSTKRTPGTGKFRCRRPSTCRTNTRGNPVPGIWRLFWRGTVTGKGAAKNGFTNGQWHDSIAGLWLRTSVPDYPKRDWPVQNLSI